AHRDPIQMAANMKATLLKQLADLEPLDEEALLARRYQRLMNYGYC
ncbi:MAG: acetyl-CoA carboxylase carboxyl transferase subunit alpha, partial [Vibrio ordalii]